MSVLRTVQQCTNASGLLKPKSSSPILGLLNPVRVGAPSEGGLENPTSVLVC